ncbi:MAG TPA: hypothetical protein VM536_04710, partial [Chloroflexia bacterium]|nr:hypothetical protein [Chloroflexia bacterium]
MNEFTHTEDPQQTATGAPTRTAMTRPLTEAPLAWTLPPPVAPVTPAARPRKRPAVFSGLLAAMLLLGMLLGGAGAQVTNLMVGQATPAAAAGVAPAETGSTVQMIAADSALTS